MRCLKLLTILSIAVVPAVLFTMPLAAKSPEKFIVTHLTSYTAESLGGISPTMLLMDKQQEEFYVGGGKSIAILNSDGMLIYTITLRNEIKFFRVSKTGDIYLTFDGKEIIILNYRGVLKGKFDISTIPDFELLNIQAFHIDEDGTFYLSDARLSRLIVLDHDGKFLFQFGKNGYSDGEFLNASAITTDSKRIYLLDPALFRVSVFDKKSGEFLFKFGKISSLLGGFSMPVGINTDGKRLFVVDANRARVIMFDKRGVPITEFGGFGKNISSLSWPSDVAIDAYGKIYVADNGNSRIQVFKIVYEEKAAK